MTLRAVKQAGTACKTALLHISGILHNGGDYLEYVVALAVEDHDALVEVVVLHGAGGVQHRQRAVAFRLERVVGAAVIQVVRQAGNHQTQHLKTAKYAALFSQGTLVFVQETGDQMIMNYIT